MAIYAKQLGELPEDTRAALAKIADYIRYMTEQGNYGDDVLRARISELEEVRDDT